MTGFQSPHAQKWCAEFAGWKDGKRAKPLEATTRIELVCKRFCRPRRGALILVAAKGGPTMLARIGVMRALNRHVELVFEPSSKKHHRAKRKLKRDE